MFVYWSGCILSCALTWLFTHDKNKKDSMFYKICIVLASAFPLILIGGIRYQVGADYPTYAAYYESVMEGYGPGRMELGYFLINKTLAFLECSTPWLFFVTTVLFMLFTGLQVVEDSPSPTMSMFLLVSMTYYFISFNAVRQMVGAALLLFSLRYVEKKRFWKFFFCVVIASFLHKICAIFFVVYFFDKIQIRWKSAVFLTALVMLLSSQIAAVANFLIGRSEYDVYLTSVYNTQNRGNIVFLINICLVIFPAFFFQKGNKKFELYFKLQLIAMWLSALSGKIVLLERIRWFFGLPSIILVPLTISHIKDRSIRILLMVCILLLYVVYFSYTVGVQNSNLVLPYRTVFFN